MGSVTYRKVGSRWHIRFREEGNEKVKTFDGSLPEYAIKRKSQWFKEEWERGYFHPFRERQQETSLKSAIERYCTSKQRRNDWNKKTAEISKERLQQAAQHVGSDRSLYDLERQDFQKWIDSLESSPYTKKSYRSTLNTFLKWCYQRKYTPRLLQVKLTEEDRQQIRTIRETEFISLNQLQRLTDKQQELDNSHIGDIWRLMFWQLLSGEEVLTLKHEHLTKDLTQIRIEDERQQVVYLPLVPPAREIIQQYYIAGSAPEDPLFSANSIDQLQTLYKKAVKSELTNVRPNLSQLRRGGIIHYLKMGKPIQYISRLARHSSIEKTVRQYKSYIPDLIQQTFSDIETEQ